MRYQVTAQESDIVVMTIEAPDMFDAAEIVSEKMDIGIFVSHPMQHYTHLGYVEFEGVCDYFTLHIA